MKLNATASRNTQLRGRKQYFEFEAMDSVVGIHLVHVADHNRCKKSSQKPFFLHMHA